MDYLVNYINLCTYHQPSPDGGGGGPMVKGGGGELGKIPSVLKSANNYPTWKGHRTIKVKKFLL